MSDTVLKVLWVVTGIGFFGTLIYSFIVYPDMHDFLLIILNVMVSE